MVYVAAYGRGVDVRGLTEGSGGPDRDAEARESARICEAMHAATERPLAHGIAPVHRGHPAYRYMRDGDGDGVVCE